MFPVKPYRDTEVLEPVKQNSVVYRITKYFICIAGTHHVILHPLCGDENTVVPELVIELFVDQFLKDFGPERQDRNRSLTV